MTNKEKECGFIAIIGRPNVGKSTLLNKLVGDKVSITANKPQTTRHRIVGVKTIENKQAVFIDTPGIHKDFKGALNKQMNKEARAALSEVDLILFVVEATKWTSADDWVLGLLENINVPVFLVLNKVDWVKDKKILLPKIEELGAKHNFKEIIPVSAKHNNQVNVVSDLIFNNLPPSEFYYLEEQTTDKSLNFRLAEIIREKLTRYLYKELPYAVAVEIEKIEKEDGRYLIHAIIWVERDTQKSIVIGNNGEMLKKIGTESRLDMRKLLNSRVHLELWTKVRIGWSDDVNSLKSLGYLDLDD